MRAGIIHFILIMASSARAVASESAGEWTTVFFLLLNKNEKCSTPLLVFQKALLFSKDPLAQQTTVGKARIVLGAQRPGGFFFSLQICL